VLGVEYLDRDDISLLPVAGIVFKPADHVRLDAVFPRPRLAVQVMDSDRWIYVAGELGGGTWAVERVDLTSDNATYRDLRMILGVEQRPDIGRTSSLEIGYVFDRELSYRSGIGDYAPADAFMLRTVARY
jgi:hypothetical protein